MIHIKYLSLVLIVGIFLFYKGMDIGADKMGMHRVAVESFPEKNGLYFDEKGSKEVILQRLTDFNKAKMEEAITTYGRYLDSISYYAPDFLKLDARTDSFMKTIINNLLKNNPNYFSELNEHYDSVIQEEDSNNGIHEVYVLYKKQLNIVEKKFNP